jgi:hypothetical protein
MTTQHATATEALEVVSALTGFGRDEAGAPMLILQFVGGAEGATAVETITVAMPFAEWVAAFLDGARARVESALNPEFADLVHEARTAPIVGTV